MRLRTFLSSTALATVLITGGFMITEAHAQKGVALSPATDWAITQVDGQGGAGGYCALARRFGPGTVLTLARNTNAETSFALDFQQPKLNTAATINVTLDPGAGQQRVYDVRPVSNRAFVVRLGHDESFFSALEKTGHLRVEAGGQSYSFNLADIDTGQFRLDSCIAAMVTPAAGDETPVESAAAETPSGGRGFKQDVNNLRRQLQELKEENLRLTGLLEQGGVVTPMPAGDDNAAEAAAQEAAAKAAEDIAALNARVATLNTENETLRTNIEALKTSNKLTTIRANPLDAGGQADPAAAAVMAELAQMKAENARLQGLIAAGGDSTQMLARLGEENRRLQQIIDDGGNSPDAAALSGRLAELEKENETLRASAAAAASADAADAAGQVASLKAENARLQGLIAEKEKSQTLAAEAEAQVIALKAANAELTSKLAAAQDASAAQAGADLARLETENKSLKSALEKKGVDAGLLEQLRQQIGQMETENRLLQETAAKAQADFEIQKKAEIDALKSQLAAQQAADGASEDVVLLQKQIEELSAKVDERDLQLVEAAKAAVELDALKLKNAELEKTVAQGIESSGNAQTAALEAKIVGLEAANAGLKKELETQAAEAATKVAQADLKAIQDELAAAKAENDKLKADMAAAPASEDLQKAMAENAALKTQVEGAQKLAADIEALRKENEQLKTASAAQQNSVTELAAAQEAVKALVAENEQMKGRLAELESSVPAADTQAQLASLKDENAKTAAALEKALAEALGFQSSIAEKDKQIAAMQAEQQALMASLEQKGGEHADLAGLSAEAEKLKAENEKLMLRVAELETAAARPVAVAEAPAPGAAADAGQGKKLSRLEADNKGLQAELEKTRKELQAAMDAGPSAQQRIAELERRLQQEEENKVAAPGIAAAQGPVAPAAPPEPVKAPPQDLLAEVSPPAAAPTAPQEPTPVAPPPATGDEPAAVPQEPAEVTAAPAAAAEVANEKDEDEVAAPQDMPAAPSDAMIDGRPYSAAQAMEARMAREIEDSKAADEQPPQDSVDVADVPAQAVTAEELPAPAAASASENPYEEVGVLADDGGDGRVVKPAAVSVEPVAVQQHPQVAVVTPEGLSPSDRRAGPGDTDAPAMQAPVQTVLAAAQVAEGGAVERIEKASGADKAVYQWRTQDVYGSAEESPLEDPGAFDDYVKAYLEKTERRCNGDFAIVPDNTLQQGDTRIDSYEIACVGGGVSSAAALVFYNNGDTFTAVAHEAPADNMDAAMTLRDQVVRTLSGGYLKEAALPRFTQKKDG